jgi:F-type H+-transporting ATPase subunit gamma
MTERLADIVTQIQNVRQLEAVVTAMRGIAASRAQKGRSLLAGIEAYADVVSHAIGEALSLLPGEATAIGCDRRPRLGLILFCAEQGFAGAFTERVLDSVSRDLDGAVNLVVGSRGLLVAKERGIEVAWSIPMMAHPDAVASLANRLADAIYDHVAGGGIAKVDIVFSRATSGKDVAVGRHSLLPIDFLRFARRLEPEAPLIALAPDVLLERLAAEYVFAQLCQAAMYAFEAENEARMLAMASAKTNIETKLVALAQRERQLRQDEITTEIMELAAGAEASGGRLP